MSLYFSSINSGSNGNCYYIGNNEDAVFVDVGLSCKEIEKRMIRSGLSMQRVKAIFISHEHIDHIRGMEVISKKYEIPVYINEKTLANSRMKLNSHLVRTFADEEIISIDSLQVIPFVKSHDAADPYSFSVIGNNARVGVFTDIGTVCEKLSNHFSQCHAAFLEANYDEAMLENGNYPIYLKKRIRGSHGHLSNDQALELFKENKSENLSLLFLAHLSKENNSPQLVQELFQEHSNTTRIEIASRHEESAIFKIDAAGVLEEIDVQKQFILQI
jgi:phosphoribosyl 1,2-cyclic phosphodiesterase